MTTKKTRKPRPRRGNSGSGDASKPGQGHNSAPATVAARREIILDVCRDVAGLEADRKVIGEKIRTIKAKKIKGDLGMKIEDFNIAFRLWGLEGRARDELLAAVRELFDAQDVGEQLDWITAAERAASAGVEHVDEGAEAAAVDRGPVSETQPGA